MKHLRKKLIPQDVAPHKGAVHKSYTASAHEIELHRDGYVTVNGVPIAHVTDRDYIHINPANWLSATRDMPQSEQGALAELIFTHRPGQQGVVS